VNLDIPVSGQEREQRHGIWSARDAHKNAIIVSEQLAKNLRR
jgi:hypothetical protein